MQFGQCSEKPTQEIEQLELWVEELEAVEEQKELRREIASPATAIKRSGQPRRVLPDHLPRETQIIEPAEHACPDCGDELKKLGEDVSEVLELEPLRFKVIRMCV